MPVHDQSLALRRAIIAHIRADPSIATAVAARVYDTVPDRNVFRPYIRYGEPIIAPFEAVEVDGNETEITLHAYTDGPGTDTAYQIMAALVAALNDQEISSDADILWCLWIGSTIVPDDASQFVHGVVRFKVCIVT